ncbi:MAG: hypothetical protein LBP26_01000 [Clostridiales bacterium]|jgi:niacin transporter|nr:hypothetical protein [Clostridiales bacterium]
MKKHDSQNNTPEQNDRTTARSDSDDGIAFRSDGSGAVTDGANAVKPAKPANNAAKFAPVNTRLIVISALLSAIGIVVAMYIPKIWVIPGVMTVTLGVHTPIFLAMFFNPLAAVAVSIVTTVGFIFVTPPIVVVRAATHIIFAALGGLVTKKVMNKLPRAMIFNVVIAFIHAAAEVLAVFVAMKLFGDLIVIKGNAVFYILVGVGVVTVGHSIVDFMLAYAVYKPLKKNGLL